MATAVTPAAVTPAPSALESQDIMSPPVVNRAASQEDFKKALSEHGVSSELIAKWPASITAKHFIDARYVRSLHAPRGHAMTTARSIDRSIEALAYERYRSERRWALGIPCDLQCDARGPNAAPCADQRSHLHVCLPHVRATPSSR